METVLKFSLENGYILAAEDSIVQAKRLKYFFETHQIKHKICKNGAEAYEEALLEPPQMIISDIVMPVMDGYEFCARVKENKNLSDIPFILLTALSDPLDIIKGLQAGADNFITKPYVDEYLISRINYLFANRSYRGYGIGDLSIEILFQNQKFIINSDKKQILDLLLSVYEAAITRNTQLIEAQQQLQVLNANLLEVNQELEAFAHTVSHDLKTPLNGIIGFTELLKMSYADTFDDDAKEYIDWILKSANNMSQLIGDLLLFSRTSRSEIVLQEVNMSDLANEALKELCATTYNAAYTLEIEEGIKVIADKNLMRIVLNNLLGNALKYSQKALHPKVSFGLTTMNNRPILFVRDNGAGFDMSTADDLFKPFVRLHSNTEFQGTGVGLSTVKRIVERHGGHIWFDSKPDEGAVFYFTVSS